jgi:hypothetical protein
LDDERMQEKDREPDDEEPRAERKKPPKQIRPNRCGDEDAGKTIRPKGCMG